MKSSTSMEMGARVVAQAVVDVIDAQPERRIGGDVGSVPPAVRSHHEGLSSLSKPADELAKPSPAPGVGEVRL
jgi:hypothetical protein